MHRVESFLLFCGNYTTMIVVTLTSFLIFIGVSLQYHGFSKDDDSGLVILLFFMPLVLSFLTFTLRKASCLRGLFAIFMSISLFFNFFSWFFYIQQIPPHPLVHPIFQIKDTRSLQFLSHLSIIMATILVMGALFVTWFIMYSRAQPEGEGGHLLADEIRVYTFRLVLFFLGVFISIAYLLSFAFAFHDKAVRQDWNQEVKKPISEKQQASKRKEKEVGVALYAQRPVRQILPPDAKSSPHTANSSVATTQSNLSEPIKTSFLFQKRSAVLEDKNSLDAAMRGSEKQVQKRIQDIIDHNEKSLNEMRQKLSTYRDKRLRIILVGHTNKDPIEGIIKSSSSGEIRSNYELAAARIYNVHSFICKELKICIASINDSYWEIVEWLFLPVSSEYFFIGKNWPSLNNKDDQNWFSVEVFIKHEIAYTAKENIENTKDADRKNKSPFRAATPVAPSPAPPAGGHALPTALAAHPARRGSPAGVACRQA